MRGRIALPKHLVRRSWETPIPFRASFRSAHASSRRFGAIGRRAVSARLVAAPDHRHGSRKAAAHVKREEFSGVFDLARAGLSGELLIGFVNLANTGRAYGVTVADEAASSVHRNFEWRLGFFRTYLRQRRSA